MRRLFVLGVLAATGALSLAAAAYQQPAGQAAPKVVEAEKLKDNLYVMKGGGGNSAVFITADGVTVVDTKLPGWGAAAAREDQDGHRQAGGHGSSTRTRISITSAATWSFRPRSTW